MRNLNDSSGAAANETAAELSTEKLRSGMCDLSSRSRFFFHLCKKVVNGLPNFCASGKSFPFCSNQTDEPVTLIDRNNKILGRSLNSINQKRLSIGLHFLQHRVAIDDLLPRFEIK